jgi:16S rRNA U516 pseudouridylate synthase RsuA-like enzyme
MEEDLLQAVIKVESEIQHSIESERKKAAEWLESVRVSLSQELEAKKRQLDDEYSQSLEMTYKECEFKAKKEIEIANQMAENLQSLSENILQNTVKEYLREILPADDG